jgi:hypothetical protein
MSGSSPVLLMQTDAKDNGGEIRSIGVRSNLGGTPLARDRGKRVVDGGIAAVYHTLSPNHESAPPEA